MRSTLIVVGILFGVIGTFSAEHFISHRNDPATAIPPCVASADVQCPTPAFLEQVKEFKALQDEIAALDNKPDVRLLQDKTDQLSGMSKRLGDMLPHGFQWDDNKKELTRIPVQASAAPAQQNPTPAKAANSKP